MSSLRAFLHRTLPQVWQRRGWAARLLWPLSQLYALAWRRRQRRAMQANTPHLPVPVLVVGNVIAGGAGKTPTTIAVVQHFAKLGVKTGVLSIPQGYMHTPVEKILPEDIENTARLLAIPPEDDEQ